MPSREAAKGEPGWTWEEFRAKLDSENAVRAQLLEGKYEAAEAAIQEYIAFRRQRHPIVHYELKRCECELASIQRMCALDPVQRVHMQLSLLGVSRAEALLAEGKYGKAKIFLETLTRYLEETLGESDVTFIDALFELATAEYHRNNFAEARTHAARVVPCGRRSWARTILA